MEIFYKYYVGVCLTFYFIGFIVKNIVTARNTKQVIKGESVRVKLIVLTTTILYIMTYMCVFYKVDYLFVIKIFNNMELKIIGLVFVLVALILGMISLIAMRDSWRVGIRPEQQTELITNGIFRFSRNPYFLSYILIFFGVFLIYPTYLFLIIFFIWITLTHLMILDEEVHLIKQHGEIYSKYKNRVNRYITLK